MKIVCGWLLLVMLAGCSKMPSSDVLVELRTFFASEVPGVIVGVDSRGELPVLNRSTSLGGVDADNNGIRDDIDKLILAQHRNVRETKAMQQLARAIQYKLLADIKTKAEAKASADRVGKGINCVFLRSGSDAVQLTSLIEGSVINTRARKLEIDRIDQMFSGVVFVSLPWNEVCE